MLRLFARCVESLPWRPCPPHAFAYLDRTAFDNGMHEACYISLTNSKTGDDPGLAAKILKHSPDDFFERPAARDERTEVLTSGNFLPSWQRKFGFQAVAEYKGSKVNVSSPTDCDSLLLYKLFAYLMLGRVAKSREARGKQQGFGQGKRIEKYFLTANVCLQNILATNIPLRIISVDSFQGI